MSGWEAHGSNKSDGYSNSFNTKLLGGKRSGKNACSSGDVYRRTWECKASVPSNMYSKKDDSLSEVLSVVPGGAPRGPSAPGS